jgi:hypothetical protein
MIVSELIAALSKLPQDLEVGAIDRCGGEASFTAVNLYTDPRYKGMMDRVLISVDENFRDGDY